MVAVTETHEVAVANNQFCTSLAADSPLAAIRHLRKMTLTVVGPVGVDCVDGVDSYEVIVCVVGSYPRKVRKFMGSYKYSISPNESNEVVVKL